MAPCALTSRRTAVLVIALFIAAVVVYLGILHRRGKPPGLTVIPPSAQGPAPSAEPRGRSVKEWERLMDASVGALKSGDPKKAEQLCGEAIKMADAFGPADTHASQSLMLMAGIYRAVGLYDRAEQTYKDAVASCEKAVGPSHPDLVMALENLANYYYHTQKQYEQVLPLAQRILEVVDGTPNRDDREVARRASNLANVYQLLGRHAEAEPLYKRVLELAANDEAGTSFYLLTMADFYRAWGKPDQAEPLAKRALAILEKNAAASGAKDRAQMELAMALAVLADVYHAWGKPHMAEPLWSRSAVITEKVAGADSPDLALRRAGLAAALRGQGRNEQAELHYKQAVATWEQLMTTSRQALRSNNLAEAERRCSAALKIAGRLAPTDTRLSKSQVEMAEIYRWVGLHDLAERTFNEALASCEKAVGPNHPDVVYPLDHLANFYYYTRIRLDQVALLYQRMADIAELDPDKDDIGVAARIRNVGTVYMKMGQYETAEAKFKEALERAEKDNANVSSILLDVADFYRTWGKCDQAEPLAKRALAIREERAAAPDAGPDPKLDVALALDGLGEIYLAWDKPEQAEPVYSRAVALTEKFAADGPDAPDLSPRLVGLAQALQRQGRHEQAELNYKRALAITEKCLGPEFPDVIPILEQYATLLNDMNRPEAAEAQLDRVAKIRERIARGE